jgi:hypothetical protein
MSSLVFVWGVFGADQKEWGHLTHPQLAQHPYRQEPVALRAVTLHSSLVVPARHAENDQNFGAYQNIGARPKFTDFCQTTAVSISAHRCPIKNGKKHKYSLSLSNISLYTHNLQIRGCPRDPMLWPQTVVMG